MPLDVRQDVDWGSIAPLRIRSRLVAEGVYAGAHRSARRGAGIEFGGHREYVPGDDLRWLDWRSLMRHDRLLVRQFETDTDRGVRLLLDASKSMSYRGSRAKGAKVAYAALVAAALARIGIAEGDPVGLSILGGRGVRLRPTAGREGFERILAHLEGIESERDLSNDPHLLEEAVGGLARRARRGSVIVVLSDLLDLPEGAESRICALAAGGRVLIVCQILDPDEIDFPFSAPTRFRSLEGDVVREAEGGREKSRYLEELAALTRRWQEAIERRGGALVRASTADDPVLSVRSVLGAIR